MKEPKVIVLILQYNGKHLLDDSVSSYLTNDYSNFELIVIDNGTTDGTAEYVKENWPNVHVLRSEQNLGYSGGFNFGMDYAFNMEKADYVLVTNNDVKADRNVISELVTIAQKDEKIGFVTGKVYYYDNPEILQTTGYELTNEKYWLFGHRGGKTKDNGEYDKVEELDFADDIFMLVRNDVYHATKGYDKEFQFQAEQFDWQIRATKLGYKIFFTPYAKIWHKDSFTIGKTSPFKKYYDVRNTLVVRLKHKNNIYLKSYFKWYFKNVVLIPFVKNITKGKIKMGLAIINGFKSAIIWGVKNRKIPFR